MDVMSVHEQQQQQHLQRPVMDCSVISLGEGLMSVHGREGEEAQEVSARKTFGAPPKSRGGAAAVSATVTEDDLLAAHGDEEKVERLLLMTLPALSGCLCVSSGAGHPFTACLVSLHQSADGLLGGGSLGFNGSQALTVAQAKKCPLMRQGLSMGIAQVLSPMNPTPCHNAIRTRKHKKISHGPQKPLC
jgi:hypothetical protein